jgi:lipoprotein-releasing system permease protein
LLVVRRKRHDIAVLLALGGSPRAVFWMFEAIGLLAGVVGSAFGVAMGGLYCAVVRAYAFPLGGDVYPVDHLPVIVGLAEALGPAAAAVLLCGITSGPVALLAARVVVVEGLQR